MFEDYQDIMSVAQAANALGVSTKTFYKLVRTHKISCLHIGRKILIPKKCLIEYIETETVRNVEKIYGISEDYSYEY